MKLEKQAEKEMEMLVNEILTSPPIHRRRHGSNAIDDDMLMHQNHGHGYGYGHGHGSAHACWSPEPMISDGSSSASSSLSGTPSPGGDDVTCRSPFLGRHPTSEEEFVLARKLSSMYLGDLMPTSVLMQNPIDPSRIYTNYGNNLGMPQFSGFGESLLFDSGKVPPFSGLQKKCSFDANYRLDGPASYPIGNLNGMEAFRIDGVLGRNCYSRGGGCFPSFNSEDFMFSNRIGISELNAVNSAGLHNAGLSRQAYDVPMSNRFTGLSVDIRDSQLPMMRNRHNIEAFGYEDSLIIQGKELQYVGKEAFDNTKMRKSLQLKDQLYLRGKPVVSNESGRSLGSPKLPLSPVLSIKYENLMGVKGYMYYIAKDQHGCRFLQQKFDEGKHQVDLIFNGIINHVVELMVDPFGNYLMQKLLDVCTEEQRMTIVRALTEDRANLVRISLNIHGTRAVQKLIETLKSKQQISLVISALQPGFLDLMKDLNGNHVVQRCLQSFTAEDNKVIYDAAAINCADIATHRHGCCVLQRCIAHSTGEHRSMLIGAISANAFQLAQDSFGNYVVQYVLDLEIPSALAVLASQFEGKYIKLSMQKFSSNVVEKCLKVFTEHDKATIILELLSMPQFEQLLQDPYANYVIQSALQISKGSLHTVLVEAIRPHAEVLRTSPYCKRIFSKSPLKK
ncbi:putative pumilio homolog 7, chloroplastic isoform X1 [Typha angustifolia]|uniref:putative pumilio homolog 7, chloroplastic isoform X1 n=1 Tax=Typha angustifolia TaxID=59011 RepID=UPI003C2B6702